MDKKYFNIFWEAKNDPEVRRHFGTDMLAGEHTIKIKNTLDIIKFIRWIKKN